MYGSSHEESISLKSVELRKIRCDLNETHRVFLSGLTGLMHNICFYLYRPLPSPWASIFLFHPTPSITHLHMFLSSTPPPPHLPGSICPSLFTYLSITSCFCLTTPSLLLTLVILPHHSQSLCIALT